MGCAVLSSCLSPSIKIFQCSGVFKHEFNMKFEEEKNHKENRDVQYPSEDYQTVKGPSNPIDFYTAITKVILGR